MAKTFDKAVTGFNHNVKYKGKIYHIQTEDSGVANPHIITHLFVGGAILATKKSSYADVVGRPNLSELVRELMEEQHKGILRNLIHGQYTQFDSGVMPPPSPPQRLAPPPPPRLATPPPPRPATPPPPRLVAQQPAPVKPLQLTQIVMPLTELPPEILAAQQLKESPRENNIDVEMLYGEDSSDEKSLDEVIMSYLTKLENER